MEKSFYELDEILPQFNKINLSYPMGNNRIVFRDINTPPQTNLNLPANLTALYALIDEISLPDVYVGYFVMTVTDLAKFSKEERIPTHIQRADQREPIIAFGSTGGGDIIAVPQETGEPVYFLPSYGITGISFRTDMNSVYVVANNLDEFFDKIVQDVQALIERKSNWQFLTDIQHSDK